MSNHFCIICSECAEIISQCRCMSKYKEYTYQMCKKCDEKKAKEKKNGQ